MAPEAPVLLRPVGALKADEAREQFWNAFGAMLAALLVVAMVGGWAYSQVRGSMREIRSAGLTSLLEAESRAMLIWIEEKQRDAERWASTPDVRREAAALVALAERGLSPARLCTAAPQRALLRLIEPYAALEESVTFNLIGRDGAVLATPFPEYCGLRVSEDFRKRLEPVFAGKTVFMRPWTEAERLGPARDVRFKRALIWVETPIDAEDGTAIAALGFGRLAEDRFAKLLTITGADTTREAYAFDARGTMLTESRYAGDLRAAGLLRQGESGVLRLAVREPDGDRPLTALTQAALDGLAAGGSTSPHGVLLEPYRNYRGAEVIGAWRWLPETEMAVAVEIEAAEAYAPLQYLQTAFGVLFAFVLASFLAAAFLSLWAVRLRLREAKRIGPYLIGREIGEGGMSHVYLARHQHLKRPTAVKVLKSHLASDEVVTRFEREVQHCSQLTHPNTIEIYDYGRARDGTFYYAMEYLRGISLEELIRRDGPMPVSRTVHALRQACASLREAHGRGLVHRDVKPHNLMLCVRGGQYDVLKVLDFGLVKEISNPDTRDITQFAKILGTPLYMAPERLRNPADADARADIYALGAVAQFLLTGKPLFEAQTDHDLVHEVLNAEPPSPSARGVPDVPPVLEALIARCLAKNREARPATIDELDSVLAEVARQRPWRESDARAWWEERAADLRIEGFTTPKA